MFYRVRNVMTFQDFAACIPEGFKACLLYTSQRTSAVWGGITLVKAEFVLLKAAVDHGPYQHYHLISGADLPIQPPEDIRAFFEANPDVEFVHFDPHPFSPFNDELSLIHILPMWALQWALLALTLPLRPLTWC